APVRAARDTCERHLPRREPPHAPQCALRLQRHRAPRRGQLFRAARRALSRREIGPGGRAPGAGSPVNTGPIQATRVSRAAPALPFSATPVFSATARRYRRGYLTSRAVNIVVTLVPQL